jgi:hypothetical protein
VNGIKIKRTKNKQRNCNKKEDAGICPREERKPEDTEVQRKGSCEL